MKNRLPFAALTFAFTIAGACAGYSIKVDGGGMAMVVFLIASIGAMAAGLSGEQS